MKCCDFINNQLTPDSHPLFATEKTFGVIKLMEDNKTADILIKFQRSGLLPRVTLKSVYVVSVACFGIKYKSKAILAYDADPATLLPKSGKIDRIYKVLGFIYFELTKLNVEGFSKTFQSYEIYEDINNNTTIVSYDNLLDYNVYHSKIIANHGSFIPLKYSLTDLITQHLQEHNPLFYDL